jgi:hypothetical protein
MSDTRTRVEPQPPANRVAQPSGEIPPGQGPNPARSETPPDDVRLTFQMTGSRILGFALIHAARDAESRLGSWEA